MRHILVSTLLLISLLPLAGCDKVADERNQIEDIQARGQLRVGTLYHPLYYFLRGEQQEGLDFELAQQFAAALNVELSMVPAYNLNELFALLDTGQVDMLAAGLTNTPARRQSYRFSPSYYHTAHTLVYRKGHQKPRDMSQVAGSLSVLAGSAQAEWLAQLTPPVSALSPEFSPALSAALSPTVSAALSPEVSAALSPEVSAALSPEVSAALSPEVSAALSPTLSAALSPTLSPALSPEVSPEVSPELSAELSAAVSSSPELGPEPSADLSSELSSAKTAVSGSEPLKAEPSTPEPSKPAPTKLRWDAHLDADEEDLLRQVAEGKIDYTLVPDIILARTQRYYPNIASAFAVGEPQPVAWVWDQRLDDSAQAALLDFFAEQAGNGVLARLHEKYFGHVQQFDYVDTRTFLSRIETLLPRYQSLFERHAGELDWRLLAAMSYQESHWDPNAESYTGVRGMMMLTEDTAKQVGVDNRLDVEQSIRGGAQYLSSLMTRLPESIPDSERVWFALASYNIGLGHLLDVRRLTQQLGQDPDSWAQVKANLPLLHQPQWYSQTRYGYARGRETKQFVNNIRQYYQSLLWQDNARTDPRLQINSPASELTPSSVSEQPATDLSKL